MNFDRYKDQYRDQVQQSISFAKADSDFILEFKADRFKEILTGQPGFEPLSGLKVLDVGCGIGLMDRYFQGAFASLDGIDVAKETVEMAAENNPWVRYRHYDGVTLPYADASFDAVFAVCVVHHVPPAQWPKFFSEMKRVTRKGGYAVVFEQNPWNPLTQLVISRCELDADAVLISKPKLIRIAQDQGLALAAQSSILYFPWRGRVFRWLERRLLEWLPLGAQYFAAFRA